MTQALDEAEILASPAPAPPAGAEVAAVGELSVFRQWYMVGAITLLMIVAAVDQNSISLIGDAIKADLKLSDTELGWLIGGSFVLFSALLTLPAGWLVDRFNRRNLIGVGAIFWSIATFCTGLAHTFAQLFGGRAGVGFSEGVLRPAAFSMIRDGVAPERQGRAFAINGAGSFLGAAVALVTSSLVLKAAEAHGPFNLPLLGLIKPWQVVFFVIGLGGVPFIMLVGLIAEPARRLQSGEAAGPPADDSLVKALLSYGDAFGYMTRHWRQYLPLIATGVMFGMMMSAFAFLSPSMIHRSYGIPLPKVGLIMFPFIATMSPLGLLTSGFLIDRLTKRGVRNAPATMVVIAVALIGVPTVAGPLMPQLPAYLAAYAAAIFAGGMLMPGIQVINARITPSLNAGKIYVLFNLTQMAIGASAGTLFAGLLSDHLFHGRLALAHGVSLTSAIFILPALFCALWVRRSMMAFSNSNETTAPIQTRTS